MKTVVFALLNISIDFLVYYLMLPALNIHSTGFWLFLAFVATLLLLSHILFFKKDILPFIIISTYVLYFGLFLIFLLWSSPLLSADKYKAVADLKNGGALSDAFPPVQSTAELDILSMSSSARVGDRVLGQMSQKYISQFEVNNEYNLINLNNSIMRVTPLEYGGFFKYLNSRKEGIPAYLSVNVTNQQASLVELGNSKINYAPSAFFGNDLKRHLRGKYPTFIFGKPQFELSDSSVPFYIVPVKEPNAGLFGAFSVKGAILLNSHSGETAYYDISNVPAWVDHVYSVADIMEMTQWHYNYVHGFFNFSKKDMKNTSYHYNKEQYYSLSRNGDVYVSTGITSVGNDESNVGFILANLRAGEIVYYDDPGAEETSAQGSAEGLVQQFGYKALEPKLINVDGVSTYYMPLYDSQGVFRKFAFVSKAAYTTATEADTLDEAFDKYKEMISPKTPTAIETKSGVIAQLYTAIEDGYTCYYFKLSGDDNLYVSSIKNNQKQVMMKINDKVQIGFVQEKDELIGLVKSIDLVN